MIVYLSRMCIVMPQSNPRWPLREHVQFFSRLISLTVACVFLNITLICARGAIMCIPQHNYQTTVAYFSLIYHSKCIHYHTD